LFNKEISESTSITNKINNSDSYRTFIFFLLPPINTFTKSTN